MPDSYYVGLDIGGSHATVGLIKNNAGILLSDSVHRVDIDAQGSYDSVLSAWTNLLEQALAKLDQDDTIAGLAVAIPGPFSYPTGVSTLSGLAKFDHLFGANLRVAFRKVLPDVPIIFMNDAQAFGLGCTNRYGGESLAALTLGTGLGSAFIRHGQLCTTEAEGAPDGGYLYNLPYRNGIIEDYISTRYLISRFRELTGRETATVAELVNGPEQLLVTALFEEFGERLGQCLSPYLLRFSADKLVIGGGIAHAYDRFGPALIRHLPPGIPVHVEKLTDILNLTGTIAYTRQTVVTPPKPYRKSEQWLLPARKPKNDGRTPADGYDIYPTITRPDGQITVGIDALLALIEQHQTVLLDGYVGVLWEPLLDRVADHLRQVGLTLDCRDVGAAIKSEDDLDRLLEPYLGGDDPLFGRICPLDLADFFDPGVFIKLQGDTSADRRIFYGSGAALTDIDAPVVYIDLPKNELQYRVRAGSATNLGRGPSGNTKPASAKSIYKRFYFVDWPVLNRHKKALLPSIALFVDGQRPDEPTTMSGNDFRAALDQTAGQPFRVRPWFEPGAWGGQWIKAHIVGLNPDAVNYAWSFELIAPENGLIFGSNDALLECSFDWLMFRGNRAVLGEAAHRFGDEFPIRFDFLDTIRGGNLSVQCHPRTAYMREQFGEHFTQDETYYILTADPGAEVYLGFQEDIDKERFEQALRESLDQKTPIDVPRFVQAYPARPHDLFLIPAGTIHCAGAGTMVLEISATPYIYTFKLYDWLRLDLDGHPRPLNIDRGMANLAFERKGDYVTQRLICQPRVIQDNTSGRVVHLPTHSDHFYDVHRLEFNSIMSILTNGQCHVLSLVEGQSVVVTTDFGEQVFRYAETFVVPAAVTSYQLRSPDATSLKVIKAFLKPSALSRL